MREILFRGKREDNGQWIKGYLLVDEITGQYYIHASGCSVNESPKVGEEGVLHFLAYEVIPETVGQYTGLNDKNGTQIFEGDIVETSKYGYENGNGQNYNGKDLFVVHFSDGTYVLENKRRRFCLRPDIGAEVIGNILTFYAGTGKITGHSQRGIANFLKLCDVEMNRR